MNRVLGQEGAEKGEHRYIQEFVGKDLFDYLSNAHKDVDDLSVELDGRGVHWQVACVRGNRKCCVHCFHYGDGARSLHLGARGNSHLRTVKAGQRGPAREGVEYLVSFEEASSELCEGRTADREAVSACIESWLTLRATRSEIYEKFDFVDMNRRALRRLEEAINLRQEQAGSRIRANFEERWSGDVGAQLWVYGEARSCKLEPANEHSSVGCAFLLQATQLARADFASADEAAEAVHRWMDTGVSLSELAGHAGELEISPFAHEFVQGGYAAWHWSNVLAQAKAEREGGILAYYLPVIEQVAADETMRKFFSFTSLNRLCFSRCSHYPFATEGMPMLSPKPDGSYGAVCGDESISGDASEICHFVRNQLAAVDEEPWHGCISDSLIAPVNALLEGQQSPIRARKVQRQQWSDVLARADLRSCELGLLEHEHKSYSLRFSEDDQRVARAQFRELSGLVAGIRQWLEEAVSVDSLAAIADKFELE